VRGGVVDIFNIYIQEKKSHPCIHGAFSFLHPSLSMRDARKEKAPWMQAVVCPLIPPKGEYAGGFSCNEITFWVISLQKRKGCRMRMQDADAGCGGRGS
jgi:hypothetical protein